MLFARIRLAMSTETVDRISGVTFEIHFHVSRLFAKRSAGSDPRHLAPLPGAVRLISLALCTVRLSVAIIVRGELLRHSRSV